jgi:hypothetical protein
VALGCLQDAALKLPDRLAPVFEIDAMRPRRRADQFAGERGDLATFRLAMRDRRGFLRDKDPRWRRGGIMRDRRGVPTRGGGAVASASSLARIGPRKL